LGDLARYARVVDRCLARADAMQDEFFVSRLARLQELRGAISSMSARDAGTKRLITLRRRVADEIEALKLEYEADLKHRRDQAQREKEREEFERLREAKHRHDSVTQWPRVAPVKDSIGVLFDMRND
jgi:hypothetical protein